MTDMKFIILLAVCIVVTTAATLHEKWHQFKLNNGKEYKSLLDEKRRFAIFEENVRLIEEHNQEFNEGKSSFRMGITQFADISREDFKLILGNALQFGIELQTESITHKGIGVNSTINYVKSGLVTAVKNQGILGSSEAFAVVGVVEGQVAKQKKILKSLSAKNLQDCVHDRTMPSYFEYVKENGVLDADAYPNSTHNQCAKKGGWKISNYYMIPTNSADATLEALASVGPISMVLDGSVLQFYSSGIIDEQAKCDNSGNYLNHAVLVVGADTEKDVNYFLAKNSWGVSWGEEGYFRIKRTGNICGSLLYNMYAKL